MRHYPSEIRATLLSAFDHGVNFFDTADIYGQGDSERLLGRLFRRQRQEVILCTKAGLTAGISEKLIRWSKPLIGHILRRWKRGRQQMLVARRQVERQSFDPIYLRRRMESSLQRLQTDYIDIFLLHGPPASVIKSGGVAGVLAKAKQAGIIRYGGISCQTADEAILAIDQKEVDCIQVPVNLFEKKVIARVLPMAKEMGVAVISREPLGGGSIFNHPALKSVTAKHADRTAAQIALQYVLQKEDKGVVLTGMTCRHHLKENLAVFSKPPLTNEDIQYLENDSYLTDD
jgi:aryl-alcohol dehydrogenase-like predicted oxidoreductase